MLITGDIIRYKLVIRYLAAGDSISTGQLN